MTKANHEPVEPNKIVDFGTIVNREKCKK